ncbi:LytTR family DNA-binding domain-containing protein [Fulvivirgaceae bacterium PWU4]|uniref:LytTR family DNA-binding domain-containing protein n=1 Tax=Chryseosolibacter histidini TaxID=2782349 RepID=A0AAP2DK96_9BACT|nr:LytTR family DNA-binding domain-containing protein [Chryseosolibacter histidini]MBT1697936.1 LytTR family DNA-binding domain-containing protein [Chryseosolibacter histidini]
MKKITCMIVEDEPVSQEILKRYIADCPQLQLVAVCSNALEANEKLRTDPVDLMFLDITMPKISGLDFYKSLSAPPDVIFTTAYPEYAVTGFEVNAVDYLVKPFPFDRFLKAVNRLHAPEASGFASPGFILLQADKKMHKVNFDDIFFIEGMGDYVKVHMADKTLVIHYTLQKIQEQLPASKFFRVHKSYLISLSRIDYLEGNMVIVNKTQIPIGQTYRSDFLSALQK